MATIEVKAFGQKSTSFFTVDRGCLGKTGLFSMMCSYWWLLGGWNSGGEPLYAKKRQRSWWFLGQKEHATHKGLSGLPELIPAAKLGEKW